MTEPAEPSPPCVICRRNPGWPACEPCRKRMDDQLDAVMPLLAGLTYALVPGMAVSGERGGSSPEAAPSARLDALSLTGVGSDDARCLFIPKIRTWSTMEETTLANGTVRDVPVWHRESVRDASGRPVLVLADDQTGVLPVRSWLASWELDWRREFGQSTASRAPAPHYCACGLALTYLNAPFHESTCETVRAAIAPQVLLGIGPELPPTERPADPVALEWQIRWDPPKTGERAGEALAYLQTWLEHACQCHPRIADFAASLRSLIGALRVATGDIDDLEYLGRCPEALLGRGREVCGAALWHDPRLATITCPRCHAETGHDRRLWLARRILATFPIDRRRRYTRQLIDSLSELPRCHCGGRLVVDWLEATERGDPQRFWRPGRVACLDCATTARL